MTWKRQVEEHTNQIELKREDAIDRVKWRNGVYELSRSTRSIRPPALTRTKPDLKSWISLSLSLLVNTAHYRSLLLFYCILPYSQTRELYLIDC